MSYVPTPTHARGQWFQSLSAAFGGITPTSTERSVLMKTASTELLIHSQFGGLVLFSPLSGLSKL